MSLIFWRDSNNFFNLCKNSAFNKKLFDMQSALFLLSSHFVLGQIPRISFSFEFLNLTRASENEISNISVKETLTLFYAQLILSVICSPISALSWSPNFIFKSLLYSALFFQAYKYLSWIFSFCFDKHFVNIGTAYLFMQLHSHKTDTKAYTNIRESIGLDRIRMDWIGTNSIFQILKNLLNLKALLNWTQKIQHLIYRHSPLWCSSI